MKRAITHVHIDHLGRIPHLLAADFTRLYRKLRAGARTAGRGCLAA